MTFWQLVSLRLLLSLFLGTGHATRDRFHGAAEFIGGAFAEVRDANGRRSGLTFDHPLPRAIAAATVAKHAFCSDDFPHQCDIAGQTISTLCH